VDMQLKNIDAGTVLFLSLMDWHPVNQILGHCGIKRQY